MTIEVESWKYCRPTYIPEDVKELVHPCGCREYEKDGIWIIGQCAKHKTETGDLIEEILKQTRARYYEKSRKFDRSEHAETCS